MAAGYQDAGFAYQGTGLFAYQVGATVTPVGGGGGGGGFRNYIKAPHPWREHKVDRDELRGMLEDAFRDIPKDPVVVEVKAASVAVSSPERFDWAVMLDDLGQVERILSRYADRLERGTVRSPDGPRRAAPPVRDMAAELKAKRAASTRRKKIALLLM